VSGVSECKLCPSGKEQGGKGMNLTTEANSCTACSPGRIGIGQGSGSCVTCGPGRFMSSTGLSFDQRWSAWMVPCDPCPKGKYSGRAAVSKCENCTAGKWSSSIGRSFSSTCVNCPKGRWNDQDSQASAEDCIPCARGTHGLKDGADSKDHCQPCPTYTNSTVLGSNTKEDCVCSPGNYRKPLVKTCAPCSSFAGVICPGGVSSSGKYLDPQSAEGWYMVSLARAQQCKILLPDGRSVCKGGGSLEEGDRACVDGHTGPFCAACQHGYARNSPNRACSPCSRVPQNWVRICLIQLDCATKALFGLFISYRAMAGISSRIHLDTVLLRMFMHFTSVMSVLKSFDFSGPDLEDDSASTKDSMQGLSWFPKWFEAIYSFDGTLPAVAPSATLLECLAHSWSASGFTALKPITFWLIYPLNVYLWLVIISFFAAKVYWWRAGRFKANFVKMLIEQGATDEAAQNAATHAKLNFVRSTVASGELPDLDALANNAGMDVVCDILSDRAVAHAGDTQDSPIRASVHHLDSTTTQKRYIATILKHALKPERLGSFEKRNPDWEVQVADMIRATRNDLDLVNAPYYPHLEDTLGHPVFGLFRGTDICSVIAGSGPILLITLNSIWMVCTQRYMLAIHTVSIPKCTNCDSDQTQEIHVWAEDLRMKSFVGDHLVTGVLGLLGLTIWSLGVPISIFVMCYLRRFKLQQLETRRLLGYFFTGLEPSYFWWELLVKRADLLLTFFVAFSSIMPTTEAKLVTFLGITSVMWALHTKYLPYDNRCLLLADRTESRLLLVRFVTFFGLNLVVALNGSANGNMVFLAAICISIIMFSIYGIALSITCITSEICGPKALLLSKRLKSDQPNAGSVVRRTKQTALDFLSVIERERQSQLNNAPAFVWAGAAGRHIQLANRCSTQLSSAPSFLSRKLVQPLVVHLYGTDFKSQQYSAIMHLCDMVEHIAVESGAEELPVDLFGKLIVWSAAVRQLYEDPRTQQELPNETRLSHRTTSIVRQSLSNQRLSGAASSDTAQEGMDALVSADAGDCFATPEDLCCALIYLQSLSTSSMLDLVASSFADVEKAPEQVENEELDKNSGASQECDWQEFEVEMDDPAVDGCVCAYLPTCAAPAGNS